MVGSLNATDEIVGAATVVVVVVAAVVVVVAAVVVVVAAVVVVVAAVVVVVAVATVVVVATVATVVVVATVAGAVAVSFRVVDLAIAMCARFAAVPFDALIVPPFSVSELALSPNPSLSMSPVTVTYAKSRALVPEPATYDILPIFAESRNICGAPVTTTGELKATIT